ncbi:Leucine aminopeptidase 1, partial [Cladochytrium tenue]
MDVTDGDLDGIANSGVRPRTWDLPTEPVQQEIVQALAANVSVERLTSWLTELSTTFKTRYYQTASGEHAAQWIFDRCLEVAARAAEEAVRVSVRQFNHTWPQPSIIARVEALEPTVVEGEELPAVILSAHLDSVNQWNPWFGPSPGADDDGSGSASMFEAYRVLVESGFVPHRAVEFHWYAAEEGGLLGSQKVVAQYASAGTPVYGVFHVDMTGHTPPNKPPVVGLLTDSVDAGLVELLKRLVEEYSDIEWRETKCG